MLSTWPVSGDRWISTGIAGAFRFDRLALAAAERHPSRLGVVAWMPISCRRLRPVLAEARAGQAKGACSQKLNFPARPDPFNDGDTTRLRMRCVRQ